MAEPEHVRRWLPGSAGIGTDRRLDHRHGDVWIANRPVLELPTSEVADADTVGLGDRPEWPLPHGEPASVDYTAKVRILRLHPPVLLVDRERAQHARLISEERVPRGRAND
jgi:hypothetical protein